MEISWLVLAVCFVLSLGMALIVTRHKYARALMVIRAINSRSPEGFVYSEKHPQKLGHLLAAEHRVNTPVDTEVRIYSRETLGTTVVIRIGQTQEKEDKD